MNNKMRFEVYAMFLDGSGILQKSFNSGAEAKEYMNKFNKKIVVGGVERSYQLKVHLVRE